jgi:tetratricopeptide (TPR) repeat protein
MKLKLKFSYYLALFTLAFSSSFSQESTLLETKKMMKTYGFSDPNPVPKTGRVYPYFRFDGYTDVGTMKEWKFIELENDFIKVSITPEIGGKIWGAYEKSTNFPFVYFNNVVKFRDVAMRGAWTSGGIELNFGDIGHDPTVSNPVDYYKRVNKDGSVSCFVGAYDWVSRTRWMVEVNLPKDKAFFTTKSKWYNSSQIDQTYYHWMNAGFKAAGDLEFVFPGTNFIGHGGELNSWPKNKEGKDIGFYEKNNFGTYKSYHVLGKTDDFFGGYWHKDKIGFVHYSPYHEKLGKKVWVWGLSRQGMIWENLLTDADGQYVELQSGRLFNQAAEESINSPFKHVDFKPSASDIWTEHWYPIKNIEGITQAHTWGAWTIKKKGNWVICAVSPAKNIVDSLQWQVGSKRYRKFLKLKPLQFFSDSLEIKTDEKVRIVLGNHLLYDSEEEIKTIERPLEAPKDFDWSSEYGQFLKGKSMANQRKFAEAELAFSKLLSKNPYHIPALGELAQLSYRKGLYQNAIDLSKKALSVNTYDPLSNYVLGLATFQTKKFNAAKDAFSVAALSPWYRSTAMVELAKIAFLENDWDKAQVIVNQILETDSKNENAQHLKLAILRKINKKEEATKFVNELIEENPLDHLARVEKYFLTYADEDKKEIVENIKNEFPHENFIEMALWYRSMNDMISAKTLLTLAPTHPMVMLWNSEISNDMVEAKKGMEFSPSLVFPFRHEELGLFEKLLSQPSYSNIWVLKYYYGILLWQMNRENEAKKQFTECAVAPDFFPFYLAKAELFKAEKAVKREALEKAYQLAPENWRTIKALAEFHQTEKDFTNAFFVIDKAKPNTVHEKYIIGQQKAEILSGLKKYKECLELLKSLNMLPSEGAKGTHELFRKTNILYAIQLLKSKKQKEAEFYLNEAETWPENLGSGQPYDVDNRLTNALKIFAHNSDMSGLLKLKNTLSKSDTLLLAEFLNPKTQ